MSRTTHEMALESLAETLSVVDATVHVSSVMFLASSAVRSPLSDRRVTVRDDWLDVDVPVTPGAGC